MVLHGPGKPSSLYENNASKQKQELIALHRNKEKWYPGPYTVWNVMITSSSTHDISAYLVFVVKTATKMFEISNQAFFIGTWPKTVDSSALVTALLHHPQTSPQCCFFSSYAPYAIASPYQNLARSKRMGRYTNFKSISQYLKLQTRELNNKNNAFPTTILVAKRAAIPVANK